MGTQSKVQIGRAVCQDQYLLDGAHIDVWVVAWQRVWSGRCVDAEGVVCGFGLSGRHSTKKKLMELDGTLEGQGPQFPASLFAGYGTIN